MLYRYQVQCAELCTLNANCRAYLFEDGTCTAINNASMVICPENVTGTNTSDLSRVQMAVEVAMAAKESGNLYYQ